MQPPWHKAITKDSPKSCQDHQIESNRERGGERSTAPGSAVKQDHHGAENAQINMRQHPVAQGSRAPAKLPAAKRIEHGSHDTRQPYDSRHPADGEVTREYAVEAETEQAQYCRCGSQQDQSDSGEMNISRRRIGTMNVAASGSDARIGGAHDHGDFVEVIFRLYARKGARGAVFF